MPQRDTEHPRQRGAGNRHHGRRRTQRDTGDDDRTESGYDGDDYGHFEVEVVHTCEVYAREFTDPVTAAELFSADFLSP